MPANHPPKPPDPWRWKTTPIALVVCNEIGGYPEAVFSFLCSNAILIHMWFYNLILKFNGFDFNHWIKLNYKPIVPPLFSSVVSYDKDNPPKPRKCKAPRPDSLIRYRLAAFAMLNAGLSEGELFSLKSDLQLRKQLRCFRSKVNGSLDISRIPDGNVKLALRTRIQEMSSAFNDLTREAPNAFTAILDTGASWNAINDPKLCVPGSIRKLENPIVLDGIAGGLPITESGKIEVETLAKDGSIHSFTATAMINTSLPGILLCPQALVLSRAPPNLHDHFSIYHDRMEWIEDGSTKVSIPYDSSFLPRLTLFKKGEADASLKAFHGTVHESNKNLTSQKKTWLKWHIRLGHLSFVHTRKLAVGGFLNNLALGLSSLLTHEAPKCEACRYGKQQRTPDKINTHTRKKEPKGNLIKEKLYPGHTVFSDQLESRVRGRLLHTAGREADSDRFCGSTVFCDGASGYIHLEHQVTLNASDTINSKTAFEQHARDLGVSVESYHTDNGVYKSAAFTQEIASNFQKIKFSGVGAKWQNGVAENAIKIVVSKARTMMIYAALMWPEAKDDSLWPLALSHAAYLYNHIPNEVTGIAPIEIFTQTTSDGQALRSSHPWGCPAYVLDPRLTAAGAKIPKWQPRSRRGQYVGVSPVHAENIAVIRNLQTGYLSPQYHIVFDDWFETVYAGEAEEPPDWEAMCIMDRFETVFDEGQEPPSLADEWLTPEELARNNVKREVIGLKQGRQLYHEVNKKAHKEHHPMDPAHLRPSPPIIDNSSALPPQMTADSFTRELTPTRLDNWARAPPLPPPPPKPPPLATPATEVGPSEVASSRYPQRVRVKREQLVPTMTGKSYDKPKRYLSALAASLALTNTVEVSVATANHLQFQALGMDPYTGTQDFLHPGIMQSPMALQAMALKAKKSKDPDIPSTREALSGPYAEDFWRAMDDEIQSLEAKGTWKVVERSALPSDAKVIPGTWSHRIKRRPDGRLNKFKSRWCFRGDLERDTYEGNPYSPLVGWPTVRAALLLAATHGWKSRQVDFTLAFCQSPQKREVFMELPQFYRPKGHDGKDVVLRLEKSIYGQMDSPKLFYEHLCVGMTALGFVASLSDPCLFIHKTLPIMVLNYCDDQIWLSPSDHDIEVYVKKLLALGYDLTLEPSGDMFGFLGIDFKHVGSSIELTQVGLIQKTIKYLGMESANSLPTPALKEPLGTDLKGEPFNEQWNYAAAIGMLLYISSNTRPDIQFAVHQAARFTHAPRRSHGQAVKRIVRYLVGTSDKGTKFIPDLKQGLDCYVDADFAGLYGYEDEQDPVSVKSRTGFALTLFGCPIIWSSKLQGEITLSSTAAEYVAFSMEMRELLPMRALLHEMAQKLKLNSVTKSLVRSTVFEDNQGCLSMVNVPKMSTRNKYLSLKYHFFRSHIGESKGVVAKHIRTTEQKADIFTKGLPPEQFQVIRKLLIGW